MTDCDLMTFDVLRLLFGLCNPELQYTVDMCTFVFAQLTKSFFKFLLLIDVF